MASCSGCYRDWLVQMRLFSQTLAGGLASVLKSAKTLFTVPGESWRTTRQSYRVRAAA